MSRINKLGQHIRLPDGREATTVYNSLEGVGVKWGIHNPDPNDFEGSSGGCVRWDIPEDFEWFPDAMLRSPDLQHLFDLECVGEEYEFIEEGSDDL
jgi:hypothetical protein